MNTPVYRSLRSILWKAGQSLLGNHTSFMSDADKHSEELLVEALGYTFPHDSIFSEESGWCHKADATRVWCIDPLDGSTNYYKGLPGWGISVALLHGLQPILGAILVPDTGDFFYAEVGGGAYCNTAKLQVSAIQTLANSLICFPLENVAHSASDLHLATELIKKCRELRMFNATAVELAYLAASRLDGFLINYSPRVWDIVAGLLLVQEAGGVVSDFEGRRHTIELDSTKRYQVVAGSRHIHTTLLKMIEASTATSKLQSTD